MPRKETLIVLILIIAAGVFYFTTRPFPVADQQTFTLERFEALQAADSVILVDIFADWCSTCKLQQEVLIEYQAAYPDNAIQILEVNFDSEKEWVKKFGAPRQATLVLFRGNEQLWFSVAETDRDVIFSRLNDAVGQVDVG